MLFTHIPIDALKQTYYTDNTACATLDKIVKFFHPPPAQRKRGKKRSLKTLGHNSSKQENTTFYIDWVC